MPVEVILPKVDMDMSHGTIAVWHAAEGDVVTKGAALFDIETDKAAMEVEAPATGRLHGVTAQPGDRVAVGTTVALIFAEGEAVPDMPAPAKVAAADTPPPPAAAPPAPSTPSADPKPATAETSAPRATPAARAAARSGGVALGSVHGTGPLGRIQRSDVETHLAQTRPSGPTPASWSPQSGPLHVSHRKGEGRPLVLLHGFTADSQSWAAFERSLGATRPLIRIDLPAHGKSPRRRIAGFADLARMVVEAFDEATRDLPAVDLLGHSLGGALAIALADIRPRRVASLSLIAPAGLGPEIDAAALTGITRASRVESLAPWLRRLTAEPSGITDDYAKAAMRLRADPELRAAQADMADALFPDGVQSFDLRAAVERLEAPTCLIWGRADRILPYRQALALRTDAALHLLDGAGHIPQYECPDRLVRIVAMHMKASL